MKIDGGHIINDFIEPNKRQYAIPVYQRNYEWSREQCEKLFEDIVLAYKKDRNHFCGSVVYAPLKEEHNIHYYVIVDGQQRLTTIYLLLKALIDCAETTGQKESITETVFMLRSVANKMYEYDGSVIERMARTDEKYPDWMNPAFSYNEKLVKHDAVKLRGTEIYLNVVYPAADIVTFIRELLKKYDLDITEDFIYGAREH